MISREKTTTTATPCTHLTSARISPKKDIQLGEARDRPHWTKVWNSAPNTVTVVAYAEFENVIEIDRNSNIVYDFGS